MRSPRRACLEKLASSCLKELSSETLPQADCLEELKVRSSRLPRGMYFNSHPSRMLLEKAASASGSIPRGASRSRFEELASRGCFEQSASRSLPRGGGCPEQSTSVACFEEVASKRAASRRLPKECVSRKLPQGGCFMESL